MNIIFLFGASCSGKSTLGQALQNSFGDPWTYIDRDDLIEQGICTELTANATLEQKIESIKKNVIIDAQIPWREKREGEFYFMIFPPLKVLLERDALRSEHLQRSEKRARYARDYVIETYHILNSLRKKNFNHCFDSSLESVQEEINTIKNLI